MTSQDVDVLFSLDYSSRLRPALALLDLLPEKGREFGVLDVVQRDNEVGEYPRGVCLLSVILNSAEAKVDFERMVESGRIPQLQLAMRGSTDQAGASVIELPQQAHQSRSSIVTQHGSDSVSAHHRILRRLPRKTVNELLCWSVPEGMATMSREAENLDDQLWTISKLAEQPMELRLSDTMDILDQAMKEELARRRFRDHINQMRMKDGELPLPTPERELKRQAVGLTREQDLQTVVKSIRRFFDKMGGLGIPERRMHELVLSAVCFIGPSDTVLRDKLKECVLPWEGLGQLAATFGERMRAFINFQEDPTRSAADTDEYRKKLLDAGGPDVLSDHLEDLINSATVAAKCAYTMCVPLESAFNMALWAMEEWEMAEVEEELDGRPRRPIVEVEEESADGETTAAASDGDLESEEGGETMGMDVNVEIDHHV